MIFETILLLSIAVNEFLNFPIGVGTISLIDLISILYVMIYFLLFLFKGKIRLPSFEKKLLSTFLIVFGFFLINTMLSALFSDNPLIALKGTYNFIIITCIMLLLIWRISDIKKLTKFLKICSILSFLFSLIAILASFSIIQIPWSTNALYARQVADVILPFSRSGGLFNNFSSYGIFLYYGLPITFVSIFHKRYRNSQHPFLGNLTFIGKVLIFSCLLIGIMVPQSRGVFLGGVVALFSTLLLFSFNFHGILIRALELIFAFISLISLIIYWDALYNVFYMMGAEGVESRLAMFKFAMQSITLFGFGYNSFLESSGTHISLHNGYLNLLYSYGIFGFSIFLLLDILAISWLIKVYRSKAEDYVILSICLFATLLSIHTIAITTSVIALNHFWIIFALAGILFNSYKSFLSLHSGAVRDTALTHRIPTMQGIVSAP